MIDLVAERQAELERLCRPYHVRRLELFGSAASGSRFLAEHSDLGFLVQFLPLGLGQRADSYLGLREALEALFRRPVDQEPKPRADPGTETDVQTQPIMSANQSSRTGAVGIVHGDAVELLPILQVAGQQTVASD